MPKHDQALMSTLDDLNAEYSFPEILCSLLQLTKRHAVGESADSREDWSMWEIELRTAISNVAGRDELEEDVDPDLDEKLRPLVRRHGMTQVVQALAALSRSYCSQMSQADDPERSGWEAWYTALQSAIAAATPH
jgi:hypothetical protein